MKNFLILLTGFVLLNACKKQNCNEIVEIESRDTILPNDYLPAYPGSWWEYNDTLVIKTNDNWQDFQIEVTIQNDKCGYLIANDTKLVPLIHTAIDQFVYGVKIFRWENGNNSSNYNEDLFFSQKDKWFSWKSLEKVQSEESANYYVKDRRTRTNIGYFPSYEVNSIVYNGVKVIEEESIESIPLVIMDLLI